jgi:alcohol dehydrogenase class IV
MPKGLTASTGIDAIVHAIESYVSVIANPYSDGMAISAFIEAYKYLPIAYENGKDVKAREKMLVAANMAGIAFANALLGAVHGIAHSFGAEFKVPHGLANAIVLPYILKFNEADPKTAERYRTLASYVGGTSLLDVMQALNDKVGIPKAMKDFIKDDSAFEKRLDEITRKSLGDIATLGAPLKPTPEQMKELVKQSYYGG